MTTKEQEAKEYSDEINVALMDNIGVRHVSFRSFNAGFDLCEARIKSKLYEAFEAGVIYESKKPKGDTSLWSDYIFKGFNKWISKIIREGKL